jgi:spermidine synthase
MNIAYNKIKSVERLLAWAAIFSLLPIVLNDPRWGLPYCSVVALLSIAPFCAALGYLTPFVIDEYAQGSASVAGYAYAINVIGGILGPLVAGYCLLPALGAKQSLLLLSLPLIVLAMVVAVKRNSMAAKVLACLSVVLAFLSLFCYGLEDGFLFYDAQEPHTIRRDYAATTIALGRGLHKMLMVNGSNVTALGPEPRWMAVLPLAFCRQPAKSALIICFGMGTTYRSVLSWGVKTTAVELIPSVRDSFPFFYADAPAVLSNPNGRIVIDDGRRFLKRTKEKFDVITIDPPPPVQAAGSSLLYSQEFYSLIKEHLNPGGILQQWYPYDDATLHAAARSLRESFPYIKVFRSVQMKGYHFLCSLSPIDNVTGDEMIRRLPPQAMADLQEPVLGRDASRNIPAEIAGLLAAEINIDSLVSPNAKTKITDDLPYNEYYWLRTTYPVN